MAISYVTEDGSQCFAGENVDKFASTLGNSSDVDVQNSK